MKQDYSKSWDGLLEAAGSDVRRLDYVIRYSSVPVTFSESVSAHSYWVSLYSVMIHREILQLVSKNSFLSPTTEGKILLRAVVHDLAECVTGDVVRVFKYSSTELKDAIDDGEQAMIDKYLPGKLREIVVGGLSEDSEEDAYAKDVVKAADFLSLYHFMLREVQRGNREIEPFFKRMRTDLAKAGASQAMKKGAWSGALGGLYVRMSEAEIRFTYAAL